MGDVVPLTLEQELELENPHDMSDAREAARVVRSNRIRIERRLEQTIEEAATAEDEYRKALAIKIAKLRAEYPATVCEVMAKGDDHVVALRHDRDVKRDTKDRLLPAMHRGEEGDRAILRQLVEWSQQMRVDAARAAA